MIFKPAIWFPIAAVLVVINLAAGGFAAGQAEPRHAAIHGVLALAFGWWAYRLRQRPAGSGGGSRLDAPDTPEALGALEDEMSRLRQDLSETQERLDFAERMLAQKPDARRMGPQP
jgi:hypothetical protein